MRRIKIDSTLEAKVNEFCNQLFIEGRQDNFGQPMERLAKLKQTISGYKVEKKKLYIQKIIDNYHRIIRAKPAEQLQLIKEFDEVLPCTEFYDPKKKKPNEENSFYTKVVEAMRYEDLRKKDILPMLKEVGIKACVYCNAMLTVVLDQTYMKGKRKKKVLDQPAKANLELDHFHPKSKYPFLCTSFYNLYPCCGNCNRSKHDKDAKFQLYTEDDNLDAFKFSLTGESVVKYWQKRDINEIKIQFETLPGNDELLKNHNELFCIPQIYDTQKDLAEELIHKAFVYNKSYKTDLQKNFNELFPDKLIIKRLLIGNYDKPEEIHKRPMAKFTYDIAKQLKLL